MADIVMPQLGETVTEGTITKWFKKVGDRVERDELLFEVSTDKVDSEVSSSAAGILAEIRVPEGDTVDVGTVLAVIGDGAAAAIAPVQAVPAAPAPEPVAAQPVAAEPVAATASVAAEPVAAEPVAAPASVVAATAHTESDTARVFASPTLRIRFPPYSCAHGPAS